MKESASSGGLNDMLDCKFVSRDVAQILFYVQEPASLGISIAACIISVALCNSLILFFGIIYLFRTVSGSGSSSSTEGEDKKVLSEEKK